jgi:microcystin-dependent protein
MPLKEYAGAAPATRLAGSLAIGTVTSFAVITNGGGGYPSGATAPFVIVIDRGTATEEKILVGTRASDTFSTLTRGYDGTTAQAHQPQAVVEHVLDATSIAETNAHTNLTTRDDHTQYLNATRHAAVAHSSAMIQDLTIGTADLADASITYGKLDPSQRWETGDVKWSFQTADHGSWLRMDGRNTLARAGLYNPLFVVVGTSMGSGDGSTTFGIADMSRRVPLGKAASGTGSVLGAVGGSKDAIVPVHGHAVDTHNHAGTSGNEKSSLGHGHSTDTPGHDHQAVRSADAAAIVTTGSGPYNINGSGANWVTGDVGHTERTDSQSHGHTVLSGGPPAHQHDTTVGNNSNSGATTGQTAVTDANLPPYCVMNAFIHI